MWNEVAHTFSSKYREVEVPELDMWRPSLLNQLLVQRQEMDTCEEQVEEISKVIASLCTT